MMESSHNELQLFRSCHNSVQSTSVGSTEQRFFFRNEDDMASPDCFVEYGQELSDENAIPFESTAVKAYSVYVRLMNCSVE